MNPTAIRPIWVLSALRTKRPVRGVILGRAFPVCGSPGALKVEMTCLHGRFRFRTWFKADPKSGSGSRQPVLDELGGTFRIMTGFGSLTRVKEAAEYASDCRGATPERGPILHR